MRKKLILIGLFILLFIMPSISSTSYNSDIPLWAAGTISGKWGLREYDFLTDFFDGDNGNGMVEYEIGEISGFYGMILTKVYVFQAVFYPYNNQSRISNITGLCYGHLLGGRIGDINIDVDLYNIELGEANYGAFGNFNETSFNWRLMLNTGPTFYLKGDFFKFNS
jgi:hypothetical protein